MRPFQDWKFLKAQYYQESRFDTNAESPVGAKGIAQFMPATWQDVSKQLGWSWVDPHEAKYSIQAGAYYMNQLRNFPDWRDWLDPDRLRMSQAAYNAGAGNIRKALRLCSAVTYEVVAMCLPQITGNHSQETITYVQRIQKYRDRLQ
jgi:soluble lytic murein transglycosylase-like protein